MNKKIISILLTAAMTLSSAYTAFAAKSDIEGHWAKDSFVRLSGMGIISGYDDGTYRPNAKITRAEFFKIINTTANVSRNDGSMFSDVALRAWYKNTIDKAFTSKYASGYDDGSFKPEANITRTEAAVAICKAFGGDIEDEMSFTDKDKIPAWAEEYVNILVSAGIISGYKDGSFQPAAYITRAETATMFDRFAGELYTKAVDTTDGTFDKNVVIGVTDVTFKNVTFDKDVYVGPGVYGGEVRFINCTINGNVYIAARGNAGVVFEDTDVKKVCTNSAEPVKLVLTGSSVIDNAVLRSATTLMEMNTDKGAKTVTVYANSELSGTFDEVIVADGSGMNLAAGEVEKLTINASTAPQIDATGKIKSVDAQAGGTVNGKTLSAGTKTDEVGDKNSNVKYSYTLALMNGDATDTTDPNYGSARTDTKEESDIVLDELSISSGTLTPLFSPNVTDYTVSIPNSVTSLVIKPSVSGSREVKVRDKTVGEDGYTLKDFSDGAKTVELELYNELEYVKTYTVTVTGYGTGNTELSTVTANLPYETTKVSEGKYTVKLKGTPAYSEGKMPVTVTAVPINPNSKISIDGAQVTSKEFDLYQTRQVIFNVEVLSEDGTSAGQYEITLERDKVPAIDSADPEAIAAMISDPDNITMERLEKSKITGAKESEIDKYKSYLDKLLYHAEGADDDEKQQLIQKVVDVVNEYDGKVIHIEAEDYYGGAANQIRSFKDADGKCVNVTENISTELDLPEGQFKLRMRSISVLGKRQCEILVNGTTVFSQSNSTIIYSMNNIQSGNFVILEQNADISGGNKSTVTIKKCDNMLCDYIELEMVF